MEINFLTNFTVPIIVGICLCIGYVIKKWIRDVNNKYIPTIVAILGVLVAIWIHSTITPAIVLSGLFSGLASTGLHQAFRRLLDKEADKK